MSSAPSELSWDTASSPHGGLNKHETTCGRVSMLGDRTTVATSHHLLHSAQGSAGGLVISGRKFFQVHAVGSSDIFERHSHGGLESKLPQIQMMAINNAQVGRGCY